LTMMSTTTTDFKGFKRGHINKISNVVPAQKVVEILTPLWKSIPWQNPVSIAASIVGRLIEPGTVVERLHYASQVVIPDKTVDLKSPSCFCQVRVELA